MAKIKIPELYWAQSNGRKTNNPFDGTLPDVLTDEHFVCVVWGRPVPKRKQKEEPERTSSDTGLRLPEPEETDGRIMRFTHPNGYGTKPITDSYGSTQYATTGRGAAATTLVAEPEIEVMPQWRVREEGIAERIIAINVGKTDCPGIRFRKMAHIVGQPRPHYVLFNSDEPHPLCFRRRLGTIVESDHGLVECLEALRLHSGTKHLFYMFDPDPERTMERVCEEHEYRLCEDEHDLFAPREEE